MKGKTVDRCETPPSNNGPCSSAVTELNARQVCAFADFEFSSTVASDLISELPPFLDDMHFGRKEMTNFAVYKNGSVGCGPGR
jgi:hypothetical protein